MNKRERKLAKMALYDLQGHTSFFIMLALI